MINLIVSYEYLTQDHKIFAQPMEICFLHELCIVFGVKARLRYICSDLMVTAINETHGQCPTLPVFDASSGVTLYLILLEEEKKHCLGNLEVL